MVLRENSTLFQTLCETEKGFEMMRVHNIMNFIPCFNSVYQLSGACVDVNGASLYKQASPLLITVISKRMVIIAKIELPFINMNNV